MATLSSSGARGGSRRRRAMGEINMVPFIDVMLVLLIIFMVTAPLVTTGLVDLPSVGKAKTAPAHVIEVVVGTDDRLQIKLDDGAPRPTTLPRLAEAVQALQAPTRSSGKVGAAAAGPAPVVISADKSVRYEQVMRVMDTLQRAGIPRIGLAVRSSS